MYIAEMLTIATGLSLDVCAVTMCCGSLLMKIPKKKLIIAGLLVALWQVLALVVGHTLTFIPGLSNSIKIMSALWEVVAALIFLALGVYMFWKAWRQTPVEERRQDTINIKHVFVFSVAVSLDAFFAGLAFGFIESTLVEEAIAVFLITIVAAIIGFYIGYMAGFEQKTKAYIIGGILLCIAGIDIFCRNY